MPGTFKLFFVLLYGIWSRVSHCSGQTVPSMSVSDTTPPPAGARGHPVPTTPFPFACFTSPSGHRPICQRVIPEPQLHRLNILEVPLSSCEHVLSTTASLTFPRHSNRFLFSSTHVPWPVHAFPPCLTCCGLASQPILPRGAAVDRTL